MRALTIGNFDGVHRGHQALVSRARSLVGTGGEVIAMSFDPHPASVLRPRKEPLSGAASEPGTSGAPPRLSTFEQRERWLIQAGADRVVRLTPTPEFLSRSATQFIEDLVREYAPTHFVEGPDFHFGKGRTGNVQTLRSLGEQLGFATEVVTGIEVALTDQLLVPASSTLTRWLLSNGRVRDAAMVLGRPYEMDGVVTRGDRRGRTLGFPTANVHTPGMFPADGVYAGRAMVQDGREFIAAVHVGPRATFDRYERTVEAHLLDVPIERDADGTARLASLPEYGWGLSLRFIAWIRGQIAFGSVEALVEQIRADCEQARGLAAKPIFFPLPEGGGRGEGS